MATRKECVPFVRPLLALLLVGGGPATAQQRVDRHVGDGPRAERIAALAAGLEHLGMSGAILAARDGKVLFAGGIGHADLAGETPNTATTLFEIASATKQFTGAAILRLAQRKRLDLDDPIAEHLPGVPDDCQAITIRHLLQHTSGIPGSNSRGAGSDLAAVLPHFLEGGPRHAPGTYYEYWNQGYALLAEIVTRVGKDEYPDYCRKELFEPAKMRTARFTGDDPPRDVTVAIGRPTEGAPRSALEHPYGAYGFQYRGMGGAVCSVWDLWAWDRALHGTKVLDARRKAELFAPGLEDYALGWNVYQRDGRTVHEHSGGVRGFVCNVVRYPDDDGAVFVLCNRNDANPYGVTMLLEHCLFAPKGELPEPIGPLSDALRAPLAGTYTDARGNQMTIENVTEGPVTFRIDWASGPVTRAFLVGGKDDEEEVVLFEWSGTTPLRIEREGEKVSGITLHSARYVRD